MCDRLFFIHFMNRNADTLKVIKLSQSAKEGRGRTKSTGSKQSLEKSQQWLIRLQLWRVSPPSSSSVQWFIFSILGQCFFQQVIMWVCLWPPTHRSSVFCEKQCPVGLTVNCLTADFSVQWAAMIAGVFESKSGYETQFGFLFPSSFSRLF